MTLENEIKKFCADAVELTLSLNGQFLRQFKNNSVDQRFDKNILSTIDLSTVDVHRSIICTNGDLLFVIDIDHHNENLETATKKSIKDMQLIESVFPNTFLWIFTGGGIHGVAYIRYNADNEKRIQRYGYVFDFYKSFITFINSTTGLTLEKTYIHYRGLTRSVGSFHSKNGLQSIPIKSNWTVKKILKLAKERKFDFDWKIPDLNIDWLAKIIPIINYNFTRSNTYSITTKVNIEYDKYPPCIKKLFELKHKGNMERFEIIRYLFTLHPRSQVKHFLKTILTSLEYAKAKNEGQIEFILNRDYGAPTCSRMMEMGLCTHCGRPSPQILKNKK